MWLIPATLWEFNYQLHKISGITRPTNVWLIWSWNEFDNITEWYIFEMLDNLWFYTFNNGNLSEVNRDCSKNLQVNGISITVYLQKSVISKQQKNYA